jgi:cobalt-zinc-cadmium efflux system protein
VTHSHSHSHHDNCRHVNRRRLAITLALVTGYMVAEVIGGWIANSLALLADAGHMLSDAAALALSLFAMWIALRPPDPRRTFGYYRAEILAALVNGAALVAIAIFLIVEAVQRIGQPPEVKGQLMLAIAVGGLVVNVASLVLLHSGRHESLNIRGAWLHVVTDTLGSIGTITAAALVWWRGWYWADPAISLGISALVIYSAWELLNESVAVLMESTPRHIDAEGVRDAILQVEGVEAVHDLHIWTIASGFESLSAHVVVADGREGRTMLHELREELHAKFGIDHITIQLEPVNFPERPTGCG